MQAPTLDQLRTIYQIEMAALHPRYFLCHLTATDSRSGDVFKFNVLSEDEALDLGVPYHGDDWAWQGDYVDWVHANPQTATLKARQLGVSWIWDALVCWDLVFFPGTDDLVYSIKEEDAVEQINRIWDLWESIPEVFKEGLEVLKPFGKALPSTRIEIRHPAGKISTVTGMPATKKAGHSRVARRVLFDEAAHQEYARELWKAIIPAVGDQGGNVGAVSTANGMSDSMGGGNFFHELYSGASGTDYPTVRSTFLKWDLHPNRNEKWYENVPLPADAKAEQYPNDEDEAFLLSGSPFFNLHALRHYSTEAAVKPRYQCEFQTSPFDQTRAVLHKSTGACIEVYREPHPDHSYGIGVDTATGKGRDYSIGAVIDLTDGAPCAELRMKADYVDFTRQLHFLGKWYNTARIAPEKGGGYGDVVIAYLRDGHEGRQPYPKVYYHRNYDDPTHRFRHNLGFPMNEKTRAKVVSELSEWVDKKLFPWVTRRFRTEARTFVRRDTKPSPRAAEGANDDSIMAWGLAIEMFSQFGEHPRDRRKNIHPTKDRVTDPLDPRRRRK